MIVMLWEGCLKPNAWKIEELAITVTGIYFLYTHSLGLPLWLWMPLFLSPDISMFGYLAGPRIGAYSYNLFHHRAIALALAAFGFFAICRCCLPLLYCCLRIRHSTV
jgi:hypothetical protein